MTLEDFVQLGYQYYPEDGERKHPITMHYTAFQNIYEAHRTRCERFGITDAEFFVILMLEGVGYDIIQKPLLTGPVNPFQETAIKLMDSALNKCPKTASYTLYRQDKYADVDNIKRKYANGEPMEFNHYLTCSTDNFDNTCNVIFIITPNLPNTRARDLYPVLDHGEDERAGITEKQVEFLRGTSFSIERLEEQEGGPLIAYLKEQ